MKEFAGYKLRSIRLKKGYSLEMTTRLMAMLTDKKLTRAAAWNWEHGKVPPTLESVFALAEVFDVDPSYFFTDRPNCLFDYRGLDPALLTHEDEVEPMLAGQVNEGGGEAG
jgi:transcriptional regulator with XRE-family HTH domain